MALHFILDGYNLIKQTDFLADQKLEAGREGLIHLLESQRPQGSLNNKVTIVFDGQSSVFGTQDRAGIRIIFTAGHSADEEIKNLVGHLANKKNIVVVTNDKQIQYYIRAVGAKICSVQDFLKKANLSKDEGKTEKKKAHLKPNIKEIPHSTVQKINLELKKLWLDK